LILLCSLNTCNLLPQYTCFTMMMTTIIIMIMMMTMKSLKKICGPHLHTCVHAHTRTRTHAHEHTHTHKTIHKQYLNSEVSRIHIPVKILTLVSFTNTKQSPLLPFPQIHCLLNHSHLPGSTLP
jgi:hypothetical protein